MKRKKFLKTVSLLSLGAISLPKILKANIESSTVRITDDCVNCGACLDVSPSEMIIEIDDDYQYNPDSNLSGVSGDGKTAQCGSGAFAEWEELRDVCPVSAIIEYG
jgi:ferredoxin